MPIPPNEHEAADAMLVSLLDHARTKLISLGVNDDDLGNILRGMLFIMHVQTAALKLRPEMVDPYLDQIEAFIIEGNMSSHLDATWLRNKAMDAARTKWAQVDAMDVESIRGKHNA